MIITVFGGAHPKPGSPEYENARNLGTQIAQEGWQVMTGGYTGTMEAVSRGAKEAGGYVIGVSCEEIEVWRAMKVNPWVMEEIRLPGLMDRIGYLIKNCDAAIALPGGPGTLAEISVMWNLMIISAIPAKPLVLVGESWSETITKYHELSAMYAPETDWQRLAFIPDVGSVVPRLRKAFDEK
jgi:uncharacterized protein (TIGR00730 family)